MSTDLTGLAVSVVFMSLPPTPSSLSCASNASGSHNVNVAGRPFVRSVSLGRAFVIRQELLARGAASVIWMLGPRMCPPMYSPLRTPEPLTSVGVANGVDQVPFRSTGYLSPQKELG